MSAAAWTIGGMLTVAVVGASAALTQQPTTAQSARAQVPRFEPDPLWSEALPNKWVSGQVGGVAVDSHDNLWVFHRPATIPDGEKAARRSIRRRRSAAFRRRPCCNSIPTESSFRPGAARPGVRVVGVGARHIRRRPGQRLAERQREGRQPDPEVHEHGKFLMQIGHAGKNRAATTPRTSADLPVCSYTAKTNELFVADGYFNHRVDRVRCRHRRLQTSLGRVRQEAGRRLKFPPRAQLIQGPPPPQFGNPVHAVFVTNDDLVYVADRSNNRLQVFRLDGTFVKEVFIARNTLQAEGTVHAFAVSPDKQQRFLYVVDGSNKASVCFSTARRSRVVDLGRRARRTQRTRVLSRAQRGRRFERQSLHRAGEVNNGKRYRS